MKKSKCSPKGNKMLSNKKSNRLSGCPMLTPMGSSTTYTCPELNQKERKKKNCQFDTWWMRFLSLSLKRSSLGREKKTWFSENIDSDAHFTEEKYACKSLQGYTRSSSSHQWHQSDIERRKCLGISHRRKKTAAISFKFVFILGILLSFSLSLSLSIGERSGINASVETVTRDDKYQPAQTGAQVYDTEREWLLKIYHQRHGPTCMAKLPRLKSVEKREREREKSP